MSSAAVVIGALTVMLGNKPIPETCLFRLNSLNPVGKDNQTLYHLLLSMKTRKRS